MLYDEIKRIVTSKVSADQKTYKEYEKRLEEGALTREENPATHFCAYFLPYNPATKEVFFVHHKKSGKWISPGGHIEKGETLLTTLNREIGEELGVKNFFPILPAPFLATITHIETDIRPCKIHYDIWFLMETDGSNFKVDPAEFHQTKWLSTEGAVNTSTDAANRKALSVIEKLNLR